MKSLPHPAIPRPRFQFTLRDTYLVLGLVCAAFGLAEFLRGGVSVYDRPTREAVAVGALVVTCLGACLGLWRAHVRRRAGATNFGSILWYVAVLWAGGAVGLCLSVPMAIFVTVPTTAAAWAGQWAGERITPKGGGLWCAACVGLFMLVVTSGIASSSMHSRMVPGENVGIAACKTYAEAQDIYRRSDWDSDGVLEYATSINGDNSLFEKHAGSGDLTLVDAAFAGAEGVPGIAKPKAGFVFKVLTGQGPHAPGGEKSYLDERGNLSKGYALIAVPAAYGRTGRFSYIINNCGTVYQKDLGPDSAKIYLETDAYDPDESWVIAE